MADCAALILAAGLSRRMGERNKLLIQVDGEPIIRRSVKPYLEICRGGVCVVTGHESDAVREALAGLDVRFVFNPDFAEGQKTSVVTGLRAADHASDLFIGLGDQPSLNGDDLTWLLEMHRSDADEKITVPTRGEDRGNPILVPSALRARLLADRRNPGCHRFTRANPELVRPAETQRAAFFGDIDTPDDLDALNQKKRAAS